MTSAFAQLRTLPGQVIAIGYVVAIVSALGSLAWPLGNDQDLFTLAGRAILDGGVPYRDAWEIKGPSTHYFYALALALWGRSAVSIRILDLIAVLGTCWLLRRVVLRLDAVSTFGADCAVIAFLLSYYSLQFWYTAQPDGWGGMLILIVVMLLIDPPWKPHLTMVAAGGLVAFATLFKPTFLVFLALPMLNLAGSATLRTHQLYLLISCLFGFGATIAASMLVLGVLSHGLEDFIDASRYVLVAYVPQRVQLEYIPVLLRHGTTLLIPIPFALMGIVLVRRAGKGREAALMGAWLLLAIIVVVVQGRYYPYHWTPALVAAIPSFGIAFGNFEQRSLALKSPRLPTRVPLFLVLLCVLAPATWAIHQRSSQALWESPAKRLSAYVVNHSEPSDRILMWGERVSVYVLSERRAPTRFATSQPLVTESPLRTKYRRLFLSEVSQSPPRYIILDSKRWLFGYAKDGLELLNDFPEFSRFVHRRYRFEDSVEGYQFWRRID